MVFINQIITGGRMKNIKLGGQLLVDQVRFLGNGVYELDISNMAMNSFTTDIFLKKKPKLIET